MRACTWWFSARVDGNLVDSSPISTFKALLDSRKERQKECLAVADTITFACSDLSFTEPRTISVEGFVHGPDKIGECSLRQWLTLNHIPELKAIEFVAVFPGRRQLDQRYRTHTTIKKFLDETSLESSADGKRVRFDFHGSSAEPERPHLEESVTWFLRTRFRFAGDRSVLHVLADRDPRRETYLQAASLIAYVRSAPPPRLLPRAAARWALPPTVAATGGVAGGSMARMAPATSPRPQRPPTVTATGGVVQGAATSPLPLRPPLPAPGSTAADRRPFPPPEFRVLAPAADYRLALVRRPDLVATPRAPAALHDHLLQAGLNALRRRPGRPRGLHAAACAAAGRTSEACRRQLLTGAGRARRGGGSQRLQRRW